MPRSIALEINWSSKLFAPDELRMVPPEVQSLSMNNFPPGLGALVTSYLVPDSKISTPAQKPAECPSSASAATNSNSFYLSSSSSRPAALAAVVDRKENKESKSEAGPSV